MSGDNFFDFEETEAPERSPHLIPWLVTGIVAVLAMLISVIVLNVSRNNSEPTPEPQPTVTEEEVTPEEPEETPEPTEETPTQEPPAGDNPDDLIDTSHIVIGDTETIKIDWFGPGIQTDVPYLLGRSEYTSPDGVKLIFSSELTKSLPSSCSQMREMWGLELTDNNKIVSMSPQQLCVDDEQTYKELLAIVRHMAKTVKPLN